MAGAVDFFAGFWLRGAGPVFGMVTSSPDFFFPLKPERAASCDFFSDFLLDGVWAPKPLIINYRKWL
jgi:hypothetical protein